MSLRSDDAGALVASGRSVKVGLRASGLMGDEILGFFVGGSEGVVDGLVGVIGVLVEDLCEGLSVMDCCSLCLVSRSISA